MEMPQKVHIWLGKAAAEISFFGSLLVGTALALLPIFAGMFVHWFLFIFLVFSPMAFKRCGAAGIVLHDRIKESIE